MRLPSASLLIFTLFPRAFAVPATITLYDVQPPRKDLPLPPVNATLLYSETVTAVGVGSDGMTTYSQKVVVSGEIVVESSSTTTLTDSRVATTATQEIAADASGYVAADTVTNAFGQNETLTFSRTCKFEGTTAGFCINGVAEEIGSGPIEMKTTTYSGPLTAYYTLTETAAIPGQTQSSQGARSRTWKTVDLINGLICVVVSRSMIGFFVI